MITAAPPDAAMATTIMTRTVSTSAPPVFAGSEVSMPMACRPNRLANTPIMKISEWAKLMRRSTP